MSIGIRATCAIVVQLFVSATFADDVEPRGGRIVSPELRNAIRSTLESAQYEVRHQRSTHGSGALWNARNPAHAMAANFSQHGVQIDGLESKSRTPLLSLKFLGWGHHEERVASGTAEIVVEGARVEYRRDALVEWYVNAPNGIEQGFSMAKPAAERDSDLPVRLDFALGGTLDRYVTADRQSMLLHDEDGTVRLNYSKLLAWDASGRILRSWLELTDNVLSIVVDTQFADWPVNIDPILASEQAILTPTDQGYFG